MNDNIPQHNLGLREEVTRQGVQGSAAMTVSKVQGVQEHLVWGRAGGGEGWGGVPKQTRLGHSLLTKFKGRERSGVETRKEFISVRSTPGIQLINVLKIVSKVLKICTGLCKENVRQKLVGTCRWEVKVSLITVVGQS